MCLCMKNRIKLLNYLCYFISGVPLDSEKDLGKDLRDVHAVVPKKRKDISTVCCLPVTTWNFQNVIIFSHFHFLWLNSHKKNLLGGIYEVY